MWAGNSVLPFFFPRATIPRYKQLFVFWYDSMREIVATRGADDIERLLVENHSYSREKPCQFRAFGTWCGYLP
jgi:hypothetical protein